MNKERLMRVVQALRESKTPEHAFSMDRYITRACGSPSCALGHYASRKDLQQGFDLDNTGNLLVNGKFVHSYSPLISDHFGIGQGDTERLFSAAGCDYAKTATEAADFIENFVRRKSRELIEETDRIANGLKEE